MIFFDTMSVESVDGLAGAAGVTLQSAGHMTHQPMSISENGVEKFRWMLILREDISREHTSLRIVVIDKMDVVLYTTILTRKRVL